jgi:hypothetical protein
VEVQRHVALIAQRLARLAGALDRPTDLRPGVDQPQRARGVHLHRREPGRSLRGRLLPHLGGIVAADPGVHADAVAHRPAQQLVHGRAADLARDVPQRLVDAGQGAGEHGAAAVEAALGQHLPVILDAQGIGPDQQVGELVHRGADRVGAALHHGLAPADDALVGLNSQKQPARRNRKRLQPLDPHGAAPPPAS